MASSCELCDCDLDDRDVNVCPACLTTAKKGKGAIKMLAQLDGDVKQLDARVEKLNGLVGQLFELVGGVAESITKQREGSTDWAGLAGKALDVLGKLKG